MKKKKIPASTIRRSRYEFDFSNRRSVRPFVAKRRLPPGAYVKKKDLELGRDAENCKRTIVKQIESNYGDIEPSILSSALLQYALEVRSFLEECGEERELAIVDRMVPVRRKDFVTKESRKVLRSMIADENFAQLKGTAGISVYCAILSIVKDMQHA